MRREAGLVHIYQDFSFHPAPFARTFRSKPRGKAPGAGRQIGGGLPEPPPFPYRTTTACVPPPAL